jgi:hypothetical protein
MYASKRSLAAHDVRAKLMQSLSNGDDDDDDLPVRAAMLLAERRQREIELSQHKKKFSRLYYIGKLLVYDKGSLPPRKRYGRRRSRRRSTSLKKTMTGALRYNSK